MKHSAHCLYDPPTSDPQRCNTPPSAQNKLFGGLVGSAACTVQLELRPSAGVGAKQPTVSLKNKRDELETLPLFSNGGVPFTPYADQLKGSCRDYYAIDSWARYKTADGDWLWVTRDAPLVTVGGPHTLERRATAPEDPNRLMAMVFDNFWHTNFVANSSGLMEFQFDLAWRKAIPYPAMLAEALVSTPVVAINPAGVVSPELMKSIFTP